MGGRHLVVTVLIYIHDASLRHHLSASGGVSFGFLFFATGVLIGGISVHPSARGYKGKYTL